MAARDDRVAPADLLGFATEIALEAGRLTQRWFRANDLDVETKGDGSPVTVADKGAEELMRAAITEAFPDDAILGEEYGEVASTSGREWIIDPIDGTKSFTHGVPLYANLLAVVDDGVPVLGIINLPATTELVAAVAGGGTHCNGERCRVSNHGSVDGAYLMTSGAKGWPHGSIDALVDAGAHLRTWGDAYGYALVATGRAEAMIDLLVNRWDIAPVQVIIEEAGGRFTDLADTPSIDNGSGVGTNGALHAELLRLLPDAGVMPDSW